MNATVFIVTAPTIDYNDQTYDVYPSANIIYAGPDSARANEVLDASAKRLAANWNIEDFTASARRGHSSALAVVRANHGFFSQSCDQGNSPLMAVFGPAGPTRDGWGGATAYGVECWGVTIQESVLDVVAVKRDEYIAAYVKLCPEDGEAVECAIDDLVHAVSAVSIEPWGVQCAV